jgi:Zn-dependent protease
MFETGWLSLGQLRGIPIRVHWTVLLALLFFGGFAFRPGAWVGIVAVLLVHELGHAALVKQRGLHVLGVHLHGLGGECRYTGRVTALDRAIIAWGGVLAQAALLAVAFVLTAVLGSPTTAFGYDLTRAFLWTNLILMGLNLLPFPPLDGAEAWKLPGLLRSGGGPSSRGGSAGRGGTGRRGSGRRANADAADIVRDALDRARGKKRGGRR